jgi:hypothetical protein
MQLPTRLSIALGTLFLGLMAVSQELTMTTPMHRVCVLVIGFLLAFFVHPGESGSTEPVAPSREAAIRPDGALPATAPPQL